MQRLLQGDQETVHSDSAEKKCLNRRDEEIRGNWPKASRTHSMLESRDEEHMLLHHDPSRRRPSDRHPGHCANSPRHTCAADQHCRQRSGQEQDTRGVGTMREGVMASGGTGTSAGGRNGDGEGS